MEDIPDTDQQLILAGRHFVVVGAGLVGTLCSLHLARRGARITLLEKRPDLRRADIPGGRSIAMSLSERGWHALRTVGLDEAVCAGAMPKRKRCVHLLGADGMNSRVRKDLCRAGCVGDEMLTLDYRYFEFVIPPAPDGGFRLDPDGVHIWPRPEGLFVALPNRDASFTGTLFLPRKATTSAATVAPTRSTCGASSRLSPIWRGSVRTTTRPSSGTRLRTSRPCAAPPGTWTVVWV